MNTFENDRAGLHSLVGLPFITGEHYMKGNTKQTCTTSDWTKRFFENITEETKKKLREVFKYDFEMYDYDAFKY